MYRTNVSLYIENSSHCVIFRAAEIVIKNVAAIAQVKKGNNDNGHNRNRKILGNTFLAIDISPNGSCLSLAINRLYTRILNL